MFRYNPARDIQKMYRYCFLLFLFLFVSGMFKSVAVRADTVYSDRELGIRERLGIPVEAGEVILFAQSSHLDPDWLFTADQYQRLATDESIDRALHELGKDPRYIYSVECLFFFKRYWEGHPEKRAALRDYANKGRIRFTGTGITTPDTLLPEQESLIRDYLIGREWLKAQGIDVEPKVAYLPDCFGHTPTLPGILNHMGYSYTAFARIDGMYFIATDYRPRSAYPTPGSSAELLEKDLRTLDFVWRAADGSEVLAHWCAFTYMQGDMIDATGIVKLLGFRVGVPARSPRRTSAKIDSFIRQLRPLSPTGYMFCPIGGDFNHPVPNLNKILDAYNRTRYPETGVYAVLAGLEDYMDLVDCHRKRLPVLELDPNPLWMGFYASRPELKQRCRQLSRSLVAAEGLGVLAEMKGHAGAYPDLSGPWETAAFSNHHDFITGTAPDRVYVREQLAVLKEAQAQVDGALESLTGLLNLPAGEGPAPIKWERAGSIVRVENDFYMVELDEAQGGCITRWYDKAGSREALSGPSNDIVLYRDTGGLWRMGHELVTGRFGEVKRASGLAAKMSAEESGGVLRVDVESELDGRRFVRSLYFRSDRAAVGMKLRGSVGRRRAATVCFRTSVSRGRFVQEVPFGVVERPLRKNFDPTFWAVKNWVDLVDGSGAFGADVGVGAPASVHADEAGQIEMIALRYAPQERVLGIPVLSFPAIGSDRREHEFDYAFRPHGPGDWLERRAFAGAEEALGDSWSEPRKPNLERLAFSGVELDREDVRVTALKRAETGDGVIVRLMRYAPEPVFVAVSFPGLEIKEAHLADGLERVRDRLDIKGGVVEIEMDRSIVTVLVRF